MRVFIVHKPDGEIMSVIHAEVVPPGFGSGETPVPPSVAGESADNIITEVPAKGAVVKEGLLDLHRNFRFDVKRAELTRMPSTEKAKKAKKSEPAEPDGPEE
jgi:hypothetical protein